MGGYVTFQGIVTCNWSQTDKPSGPGRGKDDALSKIFTHRKLHICLDFINSYADIVWIKAKVMSKIFTLFNLRICYDFTNS
jgi:hypothetical protein